MSYAGSPTEGGELILGCYTKRDLTLLQLFITPNTLVDSSPAGRIVACADLSGSGTNNTYSSPGVYPNPICPTVYAVLLNQTTPCSVRCGSAAQAACTHNADGTPYTPPPPSGSGARDAGTAGERRLDTRTGPERREWLHERAGEPIDDLDAEREMIARLADDLDGCSCTYDWTTELDANPPPVHDPAAMIRWAYDRHQHVNERRGVPGLTYDEAAVIYGWPRDV